MVPLSFYMRHNDISRLIWATVLTAELGLALAQTHIRLTPPDGSPPVFSAALTQPGEVDSSSTQTGGYQVTYVYASGWSASALRVFGV